MVWQYSRNKSGEESSNKKSQLDDHFDNSEPKSLEGFTADCIMGIGILSVCPLIFGLSGMAVGQLTSYILEDSREYIAKAGQIGLYIGILSGMAIDFKIIVDQLRPHKPRSTYSATKSPHSKHLQN